MSLRISRILPRLVAAVILVNLALLMGCGGSAGFDNGTIRGKVFSNLRDRSAQRLPEPGVTVVAQREGGTPQVIRTAVTKTDGTYEFPDLPFGAYVIGFAKEGFQTIDTSSGATSSRTALGAQVRVFIDSGVIATAPDVTMVALQPSGDATILVTVLDRVSGGPVTDAVVTGGPISTTKNVNGVYTLVVPIVRRNNDDPFGSTEISVTIAARSNGFKDFPQANDVAQVRALPGETTRFTIVMTPLGGADAGAITVQGTYRFSQFQTLLGLTQNIKLGIRNLSDILVGDIAGRLTPASGTWQLIGLPPSTNTIQRSFTLVFEHPDIVTKELPALTMPKNGTLTITDPVVLEPLLVDVVGRVAVSADTGVTVEENTVGQVRILETGQLGSVVAGSFTIADVPVRQVSTDNAWKLNVLVRRSQDPITGSLFKLNADEEIRPLTDKTSNNPKGIFDVGLLRAFTVAN